MGPTLDRDDHQSMDGQTQDGHPVRRSGEQAQHEAHQRRNGDHFDKLESDGVIRQRPHPLGLDEPGGFLRLTRDGAPDREVAVPGDHEQQTESEDDAIETEGPARQRRDSPKHGASEPRRRCPLAVDGLGGSPNEREQR